MRVGLRGGVCWDGHQLPEPSEKARGETQETRIVTSTPQGVREGQDFKVFVPQARLAPAGLVRTGTGDALFAQQRPASRTREGVAAAPPPSARATWKRRPDRPQGWRREGRDDGRGGGWMGCGTEMRGWVRDRLRLPRSKRSVGFFFSASSLRKAESKVLSRVEGIKTRSSSQKVWFSGSSFGSGETAPSPPLPLQASSFIRALA